MREKMPELLTTSTASIARCGMKRGQWPMPDAVMRNRMERMGRHGQATLIVDQRDRALGAEPRRHPPLDPQREHMAVGGTDLFADHDGDPQLRMSGDELPGLQRPSDP